MNQEVKRTSREDEIARITRTVRDQMYRRCGYNPQDPTYQAIKAALAQVRIVARG